MASDEVIITSPKVSLSGDLAVSGKSIIESLDAKSINTASIENQGDISISGESSLNIRGGNAGIYIQSGVVDIGGSVLMMGNLNVIGTATFNNAILVDSAELDAILEEVYR